MTGGREGWRNCPVEMAISVALVLISAILIFGIVRVVSGNMGIGR